jgi:hypothetical protein
LGVAGFGAHEVVGCVVAPFAEQPGAALAALCF